MDIHKPDINRLDRNPIIRIPDIHFKPQLQYFTASLLGAMNWQRKVLRLCIMLAGGYPPLNCH